MHYRPTTKQDNWHFWRKWFFNVFEIRAICFCRPLYIIHYIIRRELIKLLFTLFLSSSDSPKIRPSDITFALTVIIMPFASQIWHPATSRRSRTWRWWQPVWCLKCRQQEYWRPPWRYVISYVSELFTSTPYRDTNAVVTEMLWSWILNR